MKVFKLTTSKICFSILFVFAVGAAVFCFWNVHTYGEQNRIIKNGMQTKAVIAEKLIHIGSGKYSQPFQVEYTFSTQNGNQYSNVMDVSSSTYDTVTVGKSFVEVVYDPSNPSMNFPVSGAVSIPYIIVGTVSIIFVGLLFTVAFWLANRPIKTQGRNKQ